MVTAHFASRSRGGIFKRIASPLTRSLSNLGVGKKLLLIYLLDLTMVIFVSGILIHEKYISIDFSRKELSGTAYIDALRPTLIALGRTRPAPPAGQDAAVRLDDVERTLGSGMGSAVLNATFRFALAAVPGTAAAHDAVTLRFKALEQGKALVTKIGNRSNLILDPDLDSYYTMSLILLRYPALLDAVAQITPHLQRQAGSAPFNTSERMNLFVLGAALSAAGHAIDADYGEAVAASDPLLRIRLAPAQVALVAAIDRFGLTVRDIANGGHADSSQIETAERAVLDALDIAWGRGNSELTRLIEVRVHDFFVRMGVHLGAMTMLLALILLAVYYVANRISRPLHGLSAVVDRVRVTGDHTLRSQWDSNDEIGRLVLGFNDMLAQLDHHRQLQVEMAATARATLAQQRLLEQMPVPLMVTSVPDHHVLHANPQARLWLGDTDTDPWATAITSEQRQRFFQQLSDRNEVREFEVHWQQGAHNAWAVLSARRLEYQGQDSVVTTFTPINTLKALEQRLELWAKVFEASSEGIVLLDPRGRVLSANRAISKAGAFDPADRIDTELDFVWVDGLPVSQACHLWSTADSRGWWRGEVSVRSHEGGAFPAWAVLTAVRDTTGTVAHYIFSCLDISDRKASEEKVQYLAHHDVLTGLPNRSVAEQRLREAMQASVATGQPAALLFIDLDHFKTINDSLGHQTGDALLKRVAQRLRASIRDADTVSRFGGDEFVVVLNGVTGTEEALQIAQRILVSLRAPFLIDHQELNVSCSVGIAMFPDDAPDMEGLMRHADAAMYEAKAKGRDSLYFFTHHLNDRAQLQLQLGRLLRHAVERNEFRLVYQPQVDAVTGALTAVEALLRWHTPELGDIGPADFIPLAEESRLIVPIGDWVLDTACGQLADWRARGVDIGLVSVNLSAVQLLEPGLLPSLRATLARHAIPPAMLELELTESTLMENTPARLAQLHALKDIGVRLSIDDFGTGYSSLSYLSRLPMDKLKIDRSLVKNMLTEPKDHAITEAVIALAHRLQMTVVAEGVETAGLLATLTEVSCDAIQGYYTGRPMSPEGLEQWLAGRGALPAPAPATLTEARRVVASQLI